MPVTQAAQLRCMPSGQFLGETTPGAATTLTDKTRATEHWLQREGGSAELRNSGLGSSHHLSYGVRQPQFR